MEFFKVKFLAAILLLSYANVICEKDGGDRLCQICSCTKKEKLFTTDCARKNVRWSGEDWIRSVQRFNLTGDDSVSLILDDVDVERLKKFPRLRASHVDVSLVRCNLIELEEGLFENIKTVRRLDAGHNQLTGDAVRGDIFKGPFDVGEYEPVDLEILNLEHNSIRSLDRRAFVHTPNLRALYLNDNPFETVDAVTTLAFSALRRLEVLDMSRAGLRGLPDGLFHNMRRLRRLSLSGNRLTTVPGAIGSLGDSLESLTIDANEIVHLTDESFLGLWRLETLEVSRVPTLVGVGAEAFVQLRSLRTLHVCDNRNLSRVDRDAFGGLRRDWPVREIRLRGNGLRELPVDLAPWKELVTLDLDDNPWECDCEAVAEMKKGGVLEALSETSGAECVSPPEAGGELLKHGGCRRRRDERTGRTTHTRPSNALIGFSAAVTLTLVGAAVGARVAKRRNGYRTGVAEGAGTVRYVNADYR